MKTLKVLTKDCKTLSWNKLQGYEFNSLKQSDQRDVSKLKNAIVNQGFAFPLFIWGKYVIDGTGRDIALKELEEEGYIIPDLPYVEIEAKNIEQAKKLVLMASSQHGKITKESLELFIEEIELDVEEINLNIEEVELNIEEDYSKKNKEIDVNEFENKMTLSFKFSQEDYNLITSKLREIAGTPEEALCKLLKI